MYKNISYGIIILGAILIFAGLIRLVAPSVPNDTNTNINTYRQTETTSVRLIEKTVIVNGKDKWKNSGVKIKQGQPIQISASGNVTWSNNTQHRIVKTVSPSGENYTPLQMPDNDGFVLKNANCGALLMRIGSYVQSVGAGGTFPAPNSGNIEFIVNDREDWFFDNEGFFTVIVKTPAETVTVKSDQVWNDTGINVRKGRNLSFKAEGQVNVGSPGDGADKWVNADGWGSIPSKSWNCNNQPCRYVNATNSLGSLIGKIGKNGKPFEIGSSNTVSASDNGVLYLGVDDSLSDARGNLLSEAELQKQIYADNRGSFTVQVEENK